MVRKFLFSIRYLNEAVLPAFENLIGRQTQDQVGSLNGFCLTAFRTAPLRMH